jgi:hypothetical protein
VNFSLRVEEPTKTRVAPDSLECKVACGRSGLCERTQLSILHHNVDVKVGCLIRVKTDKSNICDPSRERTNLVAIKVLEVQLPRGGGTDSDLAFSLLRPSKRFTRTTSNKMYALCASSNCSTSARTSVSISGQPNPRLSSISSSSVKKTPPASLNTRIA